MPVLPTTIARTVVMSRRGSTSFSPLELAPTVWFKADAITGLSDGNAVSAWSDSSGNGNTASQATGTKQPTYKATSAANAMPYVSFDGGDALQTASIDWSGTNAVTLFVVHQGAAGTDQVILESSANVNTNNGTFAYLRAASGRTPFAQLKNVQGTVYQPSDRWVVTPNVSIVHAVLDMSLASNETTLYHMNQVSTAARTGGAVNNTGNYTAQVLNIGGRNASGTYYTGGIWEVIIFPRALTANEQTQVFDYLDEKYTITPALAATDLADNAYSSLHGQLQRSSPFARAVYTTDATSVDIEVFTDLYSTTSAYAKVGVWVNGALEATPACTADGVQTLAASISAGSGKTVELVAGSQAFNTYPYILGTYIRKATFNAPATLNAPAPTNPLVCYGDSITIGANSSNPPGQAWPVLVRQTYAATGTTRVEAWGSRSLYDDANTSGLRAALVALLTVDSPDIIWIAIGTNDYGLNKWSAASFGTAYAALLDDLHTAVSGATIYCQSPIQRISPASEAANGSGSTLGNYRTQISTAVSTRTSYAVYVEGAAAAIVSDANMDTDGIHPKTAGQTQYAAFVETTLGI